MVLNTLIQSAKAIAPTFDRVLVQRLKAEAVTRSGIHLPTAQVPKVSEASVIATGPGAISQSGQTIPLSVKTGDRVLIPSFGGSEVQVGDEQYIILRDTDILAKINN